MTPDKKVYNTILDTIGNTPLVRLHKTVAELPCPVYAKVEFFNPGNSIKDRMALKMLEVAEQEGKIKPGGTIIEGTSGNTGMGLALAAIHKGYKCIFTTTDKQSKEKVDILRAVGAEVIVCPTDVEPEDPRSYYSVSKRLSEEVPNSWYVNQYDNLANRLTHYEQTGPEIWEQTEGKITHLVVASGTGGTVSGIGKYLKEKNPNIQVWAIDSYGSLLTKWFRTGELDMNEVHPYITEGIGEDFLPQNYDRDAIDYFEQVSDKDGAVMARRIAKEEGIFVGYSAGSALAGLIQLKDKLKPEDLVVVVFHDHGSRYVAKVYNDEWMMRTGFLDINTAKDLVSGLGMKAVESINSDATVAEAVTHMQQKGLSHVPVTENNKIVGSLSQTGLLNTCLSNAHIAQQTVAEVMEAPLPTLPIDTGIEQLLQMASSKKTALLVTDDIGNSYLLLENQLLTAAIKD